MAREKSRGYLTQQLEWTSQGNAAWSRSSHSQVASLTPCFDHKTLNKGTSFWQWVFDIRTASSSYDKSGKSRALRTRPNATDWAHTSSVEKHKTRGALLTNWAEEQVYWPPHLLTQAAQMDHYISDWACLISQISHFLWLGMLLGEWDLWEQSWPH